MKDTDLFTAAVPVFIKDKSLEMNLQAGFVCRFDAAAEKSYTLTLAASTLCRVTLNGQFVHYGPARPPHGYLRVDSVDLPVKPGENLLALEVAGYNCPTFYTLDIPSFLRAEIREDGECKYYTGRDFKAIALDSLRERVAARYSFQRAFTEIWYLDSPAADWKNGGFTSEPLEEIELCRTYIPREFRNPEFNLTAPATFERAGSFKLRGEGPPSRHDRQFMPSSEVKCFPYEDCPNDVLTDTDAVFTVGQPNLSALAAGEFAEYRLPHVNTGFVCTTLTVHEPSVVYVTFSETRINGDIGFKVAHNSCLDVIKYRLPAGVYTLESFECYSLMHLGILVESGSVGNCEFRLREYCYPVKPLAVKTGDPMLDKVLGACYESFRQNTLDCYMDCPGRERGGWLCDSFFTGKASLLFTGSIDCERIFLDNFRLAKFPGLIPGILPMCYPGDNVWDSSIPQWTLWYVMELGDFAKRGGDTKPFNDLVEKILGCFAGYENSDGLLERLPYWNFVEWSRANEWLMDVNYPTNMLYSAVLKVSAELLGKPELAFKAVEVRDTVIRQSFDGRYFRDHAVRKEDGSLEVLADRSAICQHEAIMFDIIDINMPEYAAIKDAVIHHLGVGGDMSALPEGFEPLDLFIGFAVRVEVLMKLGLWEQNLREIKTLYGSMATQTGTIWEHRKGFASLNHGFGSFVACEILECLRKLRA